MKNEHLTQEDIKAFIVALKTLKSAADQGHVGACYFFGEAVWNCTQPDALVSIEKTFQSKADLQTGEYFSYGKNPVQLDFRRALAQRYLLRALDSSFPGSAPKLKEIEQYASQSGTISLAEPSYQGGFK